jgi:hypothetical protein
VNRLGRVSAVLFVLVGVTLGAPTSASAKTTVDAVIGVDGFYAVGKAVPVRIIIKADRLIKGTVEVKANDFGSQSRTVVPIEVAGGATKEVLVVVPSAVQNPGQSAEVTVIVNDGTTELASADVSASARPDQELVGVFPTLLTQGKPPETTKLIVDAGTARLSPFVVSDLATPGAVETYDMLAATSADLAALDPTSTRELLGWIGRGGRLLVRGDGATVPAVPSDWQPGTSGRVGAGRGEIALLPSTTWWEGLEPTPTRSFLEDQGVSGFGMNGFPLANALAVDAGFTSARVNWLVGFLAAYVLVVGPASYLLLKRMRRPGLLWAVVPVLAALFTVGAAVVGKSQQAGTNAGYATLVETSPGGAWSVSSLGSLAGGGAVRAVLPEGWRASTGGTPFFFGGGGPAAGFVSSTTKGGVELRKATGVGQFEILTATGLVQRQSSFEVVATAAEDATVSGTVRNTSSVALTDIGLFSGYGATKIDRLATGEQKDFTITGVGKPPDFQNGPFDARMSIWPDVTGFQGQPKFDGPVNGPLWSNFLLEAGSNTFRLGRILVAGWTRDEPTVLKSDTRTVGRSVFVQDSPVKSAGPLLTAGSIRSDVIRAPGMFGGPNQQVIMAYTLPDQTTLPKLRIKSPAGSQTVDVWTGSEWTAVTFDRDGVLLPPRGMNNGRVYVRYTPINFGGQFQGLILSEVSQ